MQTWERQPGETAKSYQALHDYCLMGSGRSLAKLHAAYCARSEAEPRPPTKRLATLKGWSSANDWQKRVEAFDEHEQDEATAEWERRQGELREKEWDAANKLLERALQMLQYPLERMITEDHYDDGRPKKIVIEPTNWRVADAERLVRTASEIARLAANMPQKSIDVTSGGLPFKLYEGWTPDEWDDDDPGDRDGSEDDTDPEGRDEDGGAV